MSNWTHYEKQERNSGVEVRVNARGWLIHAANGHAVMGNAKRDDNATLAREIAAKGYKLVGDNRECGRDVIELKVRLGIATEAEFDTLSRALVTWNE